MNHNSFTPQTAQLNISTLITETDLFLQNFTTCFTHHQAKLLQIYKNEGRTNVEKRPLSYMTLWWLIKCIKIHNMASIC